MPSRSKKQRSYLRRKFGNAWVKRHHFDKVRRKRKGK
jgi:hypothetical protein